MNKAAVIMGSDSDFNVVSEAVKLLKTLGIPVTARVLSAHRTPDEAAEFAKTARENGYGVIIAAAGMSAHLAGVIAAHTILPVIGIPINSGALQGFDALLSTVMMPPGVPVATVGINGAKNAALLAAQILSLSDQILADRLLSLKVEMSNNIAQKNEKLQAEIDSI